MSKEVLTPTYTLSINGNKINSIQTMQYINSIEIKETVEGANTATILISDPEFIFIEDDIFIEDAMISISMGWLGSTHRVYFTGYISAIDINFTDTGVPQLTITCMDLTHIMNRSKRSETYMNCTSADVVRLLTARNGFNCAIDDCYDFPIQETITQSNQTDIEFITKLASDEVYPFTVRLVDTTIYYERMGRLQTPKLELCYRKYPHDIISFAPQINKESKQVEINNGSIDTSSKEVSDTTGTVTSDNTNSANNDSNDTSSNGGSYTYNPENQTWTHNK